MSKGEFEVTPWNVSGEVDYEKLGKEFGTSPLTASIVKKMKNPHPLIERGLYFSHREFDAWLHEAQTGKKVSIITGRGPSERMHLGHLIPFIAAQSLQESYGCNVFIALSEDEKFFVKAGLSQEDAQSYAQDNIADILALGFKEKKTHVLRDFSYAPLYTRASKIAKLITYSESRAVFGLKPENNIGWSFYPAVQAFHILWPQFAQGPHRTLVPVGIDQDPFIRLTRDLAEHPSIGFMKPAALHARFLLGLKGSAKMSASDSDATQNVIYLSDSSAEVKAKINRYAFSGGKDTLEEHRKQGGNPDIDVSFLYLKYLFESDDLKLNKIEKDYRSGKLLSGELKAITIEKINAFLKTHQANKKKVEKQLDRFMYRD